MAEELSVKALIRTVLDAKGFEEMQVRMGKLSDAASKQSGAVGGTADVWDRFQRRLPNRGLDLLAGNILRTTGAMNGAGRVANVFTDALMGLGIVSGPAALALGAVAVAAGVAVAGMEKKKKAMQEAKEAAERLNVQNAAMVESLRELKQRNIELPPTFEALIQAQEALNRSKARGQLLDGIAKEFDLKDKQRMLGDQIRANERIVASESEIIESQKRAAAHGSKAADAQILLSSLELEAAKNALPALRESYDSVTKELNIHVAQMDLFSEAYKKGFSSIEDYKRSLLEAKDLEEAIDKGREKYGKRLISLTKLIGVDADKANTKAEKDARDAADREQALADAARRREEEDARVAKELADEKKQAQLDGLNMQADIALTAASVTSTLFGKTKKGAIAAAIIDTYAAATRALAFPPGPPASLPWVAMAIAMGFANVAKIREQEAGFDVPQSDMLAASFGKKWAADFIRLVDSGFADQIGAASTPGVRSVTNVTNKTINSGPRISGGVHLGGFFGTNKTELLKKLNRELIIIERLERRTALR